MARLGLGLPTVNQLFQMAITIAILFFLVKFLPENVKQFFRV